MKLLGYAKGPFHASRRQLISNTMGRIYPTRDFLENGEWGAEPANKTMADLEGFFGSAPLAHFEAYKGLFGIKYKPIGIHVMETENYRPVKVVDRIGRRAFIITTRLLENLLEKSGYIKRQIIDESSPVSNLKKYQKIDGKT